MTSPPTGSLIGTPVRRREDLRFVTGRGCYTDDLWPKGMLHGLVVRSLRAHARGLSVDASAARTMFGVHLVLTGRDLEAAGLAHVPVDLPPPGATFETWQARPQPVLAIEEVRYVGDPLAFIVAESMGAAKDAAEALIIDMDACEPLPNLSTGAPDFSYEEGDATAVKALMAAARRIVELDIPVHRVDALPLEPRGCLGHFQDDTFTLHVSTQRVQILQRSLADRIFRVPRERMRVVAPDTGGGFGQKNGVYPEYVLCLEAARRLSRPVKWIPERSEAISSGCHARDNHFHLAAALDDEGRILAIEATRRMNLGAYASSRSMVPVQNGLTHLTGVYPVSQAHVRVDGVFTSTAPTCSYRGAGRPENVYACERLVDVVARTCGKDPIAWRRANCLSSKQQPLTSPLGTTFDGHDFHGLLEAALARLDYDHFRARRRTSASSGWLRGFGVALFAEDLHGSNEPIPARLEWSGERLELVVGTGSAGHGHETTFLQMTAERLGLPMERLGFVQSDTARMSEGVGTAASWSTTLAGSSVHLAAAAAIENACEIAGELLEVSPNDIEFAEGRFRVAGTDRYVRWDDIFAHAPDFTAGAAFAGSGHNVAGSCHACEIEIEKETGTARLPTYAIAQNSGVVINPMIFIGQLHGGMAQGVGQVLMEQIVYDEADGQLLSGSLSDYALPRATDLPYIATDIQPSRALDNPLGVKGVGEAAATGSPAAVANAIIDALAPLGILHLDPPFTSEKLWRAIRNHRTL